MASLPIVTLKDHFAGCRLQIDPGITAGGDSDSDIDDGDDDR